MTNKTIYKNMLRIPALTAALLMFSCDLQIDETDSLITEGPSDVFNGVENPASSVDNLYNAITSQMGTQEELYALTEVTTDEQVVPTRGTDWGDNGLWRTLHAHTWGPTHKFITDLWNNKNGAVLRATQIIDPLSNANAEQIAHAKFMRAYNMWLVMDSFGQVPFRNPTDGPDVTPDVMTRQEAYAYVVQDLEDAIAGLPASVPTASSKTRAVKATARWLLAKVKLNSIVYNGTYADGDLQAVIDLVDEIEAEGYALVNADYFDMFAGPDFSNTDVIWALATDVNSKIWNSLHYSQGEFIPNSEDAGTNAGGGWNGFTTLAEFYDKFEGPPETNVINSGQEERRGYTHTLESTNAENEGFGFGFQLGQMYGWRDGAAVALEARGGKPLIFTKELPGLIGNNDVTGIRLLKYSPANGSGVLGTVIARFADAHLMRAEAMLRKGDAGAALAEVNELRAMRENTSALGALDEAALLDERGRELYLEFVRRNDLIRFGVFKSAWEFKEEGDGHTDLFPIPASAILSNPGLVQNSGY